MNILNFLVFILYMLLVDYFVEMITFDYKKYIKKDKYLKNVKFKRNWKEEYFKNKYQIEK